MNKKTDPLFFLRNETNLLLQMNAIYTGSYNVLTDHHSIEKIYMKNKCLCLNQKSTLTVNIRGIKSSSDIISFNIYIYKLHDAFSTC